MSRKTTIIGFYGGPAIGKSAAAWTAAAWLKKHGASVELANEYVKRWAWQGREIRPLDELYVLAKQVAEESNLLGKVDFIVTEKPVLLDLAYCRIYQPPEIVEAVEQTVAAHYKHVAAQGHRHVTVLFRRSAGYDTRGRYENRRQAELVDAVATQALGELACDGRFIKVPLGLVTIDSKKPAYEIITASRNRIPQLMERLCTR